MKLPLIIIIFLLLLQTSLAITLSQGDSTTINGREIKIITIQESKAIISVDGEKKIINDGQTENINGVKIEITEIFYANELSTISLNISLSYECGDNKCNIGETPENCCKDCPCQINEKCTDEGCIIPECLVDADCNDNNPLTDDSCSDYKCKYKQIKCKKDIECNDNDPDTDDFCDHGKCKNIQNWLCKSDIDCDDNNPCTQDLCVNKDCQYKQIENCKEEPIKKEETEKIESEVKQGFFKRILDWIKNLF